MQAPSFALQDQDGKTVTLESFKGKKLVLYFYPKADTPGCTTQACGLRDNIAELKAKGVVVVGVSPDEAKNLKKFQQKYNLNFTLLGDPSTKTLQAYKVWGEKSFMGRKYMGVLRTTFLIDERSEIVKRYDNVKPESHADMIIADVHGTKTSPKGDVVVKDIHVPKKVRTIPMKAPSRKSPTKTVDKKVISKSARKIVSNPKTIKKLAVKKAVKKNAAKKKK